MRTQRFVQIATTTLEATCCLDTLAGLTRCPGPKPRPAEVRMKRWLLSTATLAAGSTATRNLWSRRDPLAMRAYKRLPITEGPYFLIARPGAFGSSGHHLKDRRTLLEIRVAVAALDALKRHYGFELFHLVGQSGGGHTVAGLAQLRGDIGCAVITPAQLLYVRWGVTEGTRLSGSTDFTIRSTCLSMNCGDQFCG